MIEHLLEIMEAATAQKKTLRISSPVSYRKVLRQRRAKERRQVKPTISQNASVLPKPLPLQNPHPRNRPRGHSAGTN